MARIRTIKPEFFTSEDVVALSPMARLLYIATWCDADKEGRLLWKPRTFKLRYFPGDDTDIDALCRELIASGLVVLYGDGMAYIPTFRKHQHINPRESDSTLPDPKDLTRADASARVTDGETTRREEGKEGREGKGREGVLEPTALVESASPTRPEPCPTDEIVSLYHEHCRSLPRITVLNDARRKAISARWREVITDPDTRKAESPRSEALSWFAWFFGYVSESRFLTGRTSGPKGAFTANLDWLMAPTNFAKVVDGNYHREAA